MEMIAVKFTAAQWLLSELLFTYHMTEKMVCEHAALRSDQIASVDAGNNRFGVINKLLVAYCKCLKKRDEELKENAGDRCDAYNSPQIENYADKHGSVEQ